MSLNIEERIAEQNEEDGSRLEDTITFCYPWILTFEDDENNEILFLQRFQTTYNFYTVTWDLILSKENISVYTSTYASENDEKLQLASSEDKFIGACRRVWNGQCYISYTMFYDMEMRFEYYSSPRIHATSSPYSEAFYAPDGSLKKASEATSKKKISKMVIFIELVLPAKNFYRPFDLPLYAFNKSGCKPYPEDIENDSKFQFLKESDYSIKCTDGLMPSNRAILYRSSKFLQKHLMPSKEVDELAVDHLIDVVKPIVIFIHTQCFQLPETYQLDYVARLLKAIDFFQPLQGDDLKQSIQQSLCQKFVQEKHNFNSILKWVSIASQNFFQLLETMATIVIAKKFYHEWHQTFPEFERDASNPRYYEVFGVEEVPWIFDAVEDLVKESFYTNVILD